MSDDNEHQDHEHAGPHVGASLGKKVGPLPAGAWLAAIFGGLLIAYMVRRNKSASVTPDANGSTTGQDTSGVTIPAQGGVAGYDPSADMPGQAGYGNTQTPITTNSQWQTRAVTVLVGRLYDPVMADRAIGDYLAGNPLTTVERAIVNEALIALGPPPQSPPPPPSADGPPVTVHPPVKAPGPVGPPTPPVVHKPPAPKPPVVHKPPAPPKKGPSIRTYRVQKNDTLSGIASHLHVSESVLKRYNPALFIHPNLIFPGEIVRYPA